MVSLTVDGGVLGVQVHGYDRLWSLRDHIDISLRNVRDISHDPDRVKQRWSGFRAPGTWIPGVLKAGTFHKDGKTVFFDVHDPANAIVIELRDEAYSELVLEVDDPERVVAAVKAALPDVSGAREQGPSTALAS
jgi:hypothetical protein